MYGSFDKPPVWALPYRVVRDVPGAGTIHVSYHATLEKAEAVAKAKARKSLRNGAKVAAYRAVENR